MNDRYIPICPDLRDFDHCERTMPQEDFMGLVLFAAIRMRQPRALPNRLRMPYTTG